MLQNFNSVKRVMIFINNPNNDIAFLFEPCKMMPLRAFIYNAEGVRKNLSKQNQPTIKCEALPELG